MIQSQTISGMTAMQLAGLDSERFLIDCGTIWLMGVFRVSYVTMISGRDDIVHENIKIKARGRPKRIDRDAVIRSAFDLYWEHGVEHVPLTRVAEKANVNRVSIYHEFGGEENLLLESLRLYKQAFQSRIKQIDEKADLPAVVHVMFKSVIFDGALDWSKPEVALFKNDNSSIKRGPNHLGCFYLQTKSVRNLLRGSHSLYFDRFDSSLVERLMRCIDAAREKGTVLSHLDPKKISEFLVLQLGLFQTLRKSNCSERKMLDAFSFVESLVIPKKYRL